MTSNVSFNAKGYRQCGDYIFFWGSVLSSWDQTCAFKGAVAMDYLLPHLGKERIPHPPLDSSPGKLISAHTFNCGEQFMMACKAFLFESNLTFPVLKAILGALRPADQKRLGRNVPNYDDQVWNEASKYVVVASQLARAERNPELRDIYVNATEKTTFVEGSPSDNIWGVGLHWKDKMIENPKNWRGRNRLGICHHEAAKEWRQRQQEKKDVQEEKAQQEQFEKDHVDRKQSQENQREHEPVQQQDTSDESRSKKRPRTSSTPEGRGGRSDRWNSRRRKRNYGGQFGAEMAHCEEDGENEKKHNVVEQKRDQYVDIVGEGRER